MIGRENVQVPSPVYEPEREGVAVGALETVVVGTMIGSADGMATKVEVGEGMEEDMVGTFDQMRVVVASGAGMEVDAGRFVAVARYLMALEEALITHCGSFLATARFTFLCEAFRLEDDRLTWLETARFE